MDMVFITCVTLLYIVANITNICYATKVKYGKKYLFHMSLPTFIGVLFFLTIYLYGIIRGLNSFQYEVLIFAGWMLSSICFSIVTSIIVIFKIIMDKEYKNLDVVALYLIGNIFYFPAAVIVTVLLGFVWIVVGRKNINNRIIEV